VRQSGHWQATVFRQVYVTAKADPPAGITAPTAVVPWKPPLRARAIEGRLCVRDIQGMHLDRRGVDEVAGVVAGCIAKTEFAQCSA
jgi:hypothetical protein